MMHITQYGGLDPSRDMVQGPQIWGARGPDMGTTSEGHICLYEAVWTLVFGPIIWWFCALFGHFGQYPQIGHLGSQTPVFGHIPILGSKGISTKNDPDVQNWTSGVQNLSGT